MDFTLQPTQRPLQTIRKVLNGEAVCALIDDAQRAELSHIEGADGVRTVWASVELPPMAIVAFPDAPADERKRFEENLSKVCDDNGQSACAEVGIVSLKATGATDYTAVSNAYGK
jgi:ABC-type phosphate/phosphonate transport system substrate-binding protein